MHCHEIKNILSLTDSITSSGQPRRHQFQQIADSGYHAVINLAMPTSDHALEDESQVVTALGMRYISIPVPFEAPTAAHLSEFFHHMQELQGQKVWVHCALNYRASAFLYQYCRLILKEPEPKASRAILPDWQVDDVWRQFMQLSLDDVVT